MKLHTANTLLMPDFIDCMDSHNYDVLVMEGEATEAEKLERWSLIFNTYIEGVGGADHIAFMNNEKSIWSKVGKIARITAMVNTCLNLIECGMTSPHLIEQINAHSTHYKVQIVPRETSKGNLLRVLSLLKRDEKDLNDLIGKRETMSKNGKKGSDTTIADNVAAMSTIIGLQLRLRDMTVTDYIGYWKQSQAISKAKMRQANSYGKKAA